MRWSPARANSVGRGDGSGRCGVGGSAYRGESRPEATRATLHSGRYVSPFVFASSVLTSSALKPLAVDNGDRRCSADPTMAAEAAKVPALTSTATAGWCTARVAPDGKPST